jgi:hypothetical protein
MKRIVLAACLSLFLGNPIVPRPVSAAPPEKSPGQVALEAASRSQQFVFFLFWKDDNSATQAMRQTLAQSVRARPSQATWVAVQTTDPSERAVVEQFEVSRAPLPLVLAIAPNGAITGGFPLQLTEAELMKAMVSPGMAQCLKALQARKVVLLCVQSPQQATPVGVRDFQADPQYRPHTEVVTLDPANPDDATHLKAFQIEPKPAVPVILLLAPPGTVVGKFESSVTKHQLVEQLKSAKSGRC